MSGILKQNSYGKSAVRLTKVVRHADHHDLMEMSVDIELEGDFAESYTAGDNGKIVATDSMKNTVYVLGKETEFEDIETFANTLARHFTASYPQVTDANVAITQTGWQRIAVDGMSHPFAFVGAGSDRRICNARIGADKALQLSGGIRGLSVLKTTASEFSGFVRDKYTTLKETTDRIFATNVDAEWTFAPGPADYNACFDLIRAAMLKTFANHHSLAVQQTLLLMGEAALEACESVQSIRLTMPNKHRILVNLEPFELENANEIFVATDEPFGLIAGTVERQ